MFNLENEMDDLLRRAAEAYPLKAGDDRWSEIRSQLQPLHSNSKTGFAWFTFLLITAVLVCGVSTHDLILFTGFKNKKSSITGSLQNTYNDIHIRRSTISKSNSSGLPGLVNHSRAHTHIVTEDSVSTISKRKGIPNYEDRINFELITFAEPGPLTIIPLKPKQQPIQVTELPEKVPIKSLVKNKFYAGLFAGIHTNNVKGNSPGKAGFSAGILAGYNLNKQWSIETGLSFSKMMYTSLGQYFDKGDMMSRMPAGTEMTDVKGSYHVFEIPVKLKFNIGSNHNNHLFTTVGLSSYVMTKEKNIYFMMYNGTGEKVDGEYNNLHTYLASTIDLSVGYELRAKKLCIRFEPYAQIPLKGMGIGKVPVTSFGLRMAITH